MSRRIAVFALAAGTVLMVGPVSADQECFDGTCSPPATVDAPAETPHVSDEVVHSPADLVRKLAEPPHASVDAIASPEDVTRAHAAADNHDVVPKPEPSVAAAPTPEPAAEAVSAAEPAKDFAKMPPVEVPPPPVVARKLPPEQRIYPKSAPEPAVRHVERQLPRPPAPRFTEPDAPPPVEASAQVASRVAVAVRYAPAPRRSGSPKIVVVAPPVAEDGTIAGPAVVRPDPNWRLCQIDARTGVQHYCTTASYHPYGQGGYRPLGSYRAYRTAPGYVTTQPDARIISLDD